MKIVDSQVSMTGMSEYRQTQEITETRTIIPSDLQVSLENQDKLEISDNARNALKKALELNQTRVNEAKTQLTPNEKLRIRIFGLWVEVVGNGKIEIKLLGKSPTTVATPSGGAPVNITATAPVIQIKRHEFYRESQKMSFTARGLIKTADGKEIAFDTKLMMSREFAAERFSITQEPQFKDPLVVNFDGPAAALTDTKFSFDLDNDGQEDQLSFLKPGSGFLALDQNQDGRINNGSELFGTASGNGFGDLARYDLDKNGWIDENDAVFDKLRIWTKDENGDDALFGLGQKGIGAIYLGNVTTQFGFKNETNETQGELRSTGIFLREDGSAGTVQQIDLAV